jgi:hypothetical protein
VSVPLGEAPVFQSATASSAASQGARSDNQTTNNSTSVMQMISAPSAQPPHRRRENIAKPNELFVSKWSDPSATPPHPIEHASVSNTGAGFALFVPIARDPMRFSTNTPQRSRSSGG